MKLSLLKTLSLGVAAGAISLCSAAQAQTTMGDPMPMTPPMGTMTPAPTMMPMPVSGTVLRYYTDRAGYVSAMDVQAADGVKMVRFAPSMAQNVTTMYPVGSTASVYVTSSMMGQMTNYDLAGTGPDMPAPTSMMMPMMVSDIDLLKAEPFTTLGAKSMRYSGKLSSAIVDPDSGQVLALVLDKKTLIRVPRENRQIQSSKGILGTVPLIKGADVVAYGVPEAARFGAVSPYESRVIATGISVNGTNLTAYGFGNLKTAKASTLLGLNIPFFGGSATKTDSDMATMGYTPYMEPGTMDPMMPPAPGMMPAPTAPAM